MTGFDESTASTDELFEYCLKEYKSNNPIVQILFKNFFSKIYEITNILDKNDRILEVGCGAGDSSLRIFNMLNGQKFEVSDVDERYVKRLKEINFPLKVTRESILRLNRDDNEFDCIFMLEVLEHIKEYKLALSELFRVSRKYVVISVPNEPFWRILNVLRGKYLKDWGNTTGHINHWSSSKFSRLISQYGKVMKVYTPVPWIIVLARVY